MSLRTAAVVRVAERAPALTRRAAAAVLRQPWWALVLLGYALARLAGFLVVAATARFQQTPNLWIPTSPATYLDMTLLWDASWYRLIAEDGYPPSIPVDPATGDPQQSAWAFYPAFPLTVRVVMNVTGWDFRVAGGLTSLLLGAAAVVALAGLVRRVAGTRVGVATALLVSVAPASPIFQMAYTESMALLVLSLALTALVARRYVLAVPAVLLLALTRPIAAPFAAVVLVHAVVRWRRRASDPFPLTQQAAVVCLGLASGAASLLWPTVVGWRTGRGDGYAATMAAWRSSGEVELFGPTLDMARFLLGERGGVVLLVVLAAALLLAFLGPWARPLGPELRAWALAYPLYLAAVLEPWTSTFRYLLLLFPLATLLAVASRSRAYLASLVAAGLAGTVVWVPWLLRFRPPTDFPP